MKNNNNAYKVVQLLKDKNLTLGSVESVTGGLFGNTITNIAGSSSVYKGGIICYTKDIKDRILNVPSNILEKDGVVSKPCAISLSQNGCSVLKADICVSFVGNAGPTTDDDKATVGECYIGIAYKDEVKCISLNLDNNYSSREMFKKSLIDTALEEILKIFGKNS